MDKRWQTEWLIDPGHDPPEIPAFNFLKNQPTSPRVQLLAILTSVCSVGPDQWFDHQSHAPMKGELADLHEARDKQGDMLYRLFLLWRREERVVIAIDGRAKPNKTVLPGADYKEIRRLADLAGQEKPPLATADDFAQTLLKAP